MKVIKFAPGLIPVLKHGTHDQKTHGNWAHGSVIGDFTLDDDADSKKLATYSHPNGTRVIFQNLSKVESSSPMVKETLEIVSELSKKYPVENLTFVVQSGEGGGVVTRGYDGVAFFPSDSESAKQNQAYLEYKKMPTPTDPTAPYIAIRQRAIAPDSVPRVTYIGAGGVIRPQKTQEQKVAYLKELITHEWGHALDKRSESLSDSQFKNRDKTSTSNYGNKNGREFFAETFAAFELGGLVKDNPNNIPNYKKASEYLNMSSLKSKISKESFEGFIVFENFEDGEPLLIEGRLPLDFNEPFVKHEQHDQKTHGNWAGVGGMATQGKELLSAEQIKEIESILTKIPTDHLEALVASGTKVKIMDSPKAMNPDEAPHFHRADNEIRLDKNSGASALLHEIGHALDFNAKSGDGFLSDDPNFRKIIKDSMFPSFSFRNGFARTEEFAVSYENFFLDGGEFVGAKPTKEFKQVMDGIGQYILSERIQKHQQHDQSTHGNWADGQYPTKDSHPELKNSLKEYVSEYPEEIGYASVNRHLRLGDSNYTQEAMDKVKKVISDLDKTVELSPRIVEPTTVYKGVHEKLIFQLEKLGVGGTFKDKGFTSVSPKKEIALGFPSFQSGNLIEIDIPSGVKAINPYKYFGRSSVNGTRLANEKELILGRGSNFEITGIEKTEYGTTIKARLVP